MFQLSIYPFVGHDTDMWVDPHSVACWLCLIILLLWLRERDSICKSRVLLICDSSMAGPHGIDWMYLLNQRGKHTYIGSHPCCMWLDQKIGTQAQLPPPSLGRYLHMLQGPLGSECMKMVAEGATWEGVSGPELRPNHTIPCVAAASKLHTPWGGEEGDNSKPPPPLPGNVQHGQPTHWDLWGHAIYGQVLSSRAQGMLGGCRSFVSPRSLIYMLFFGANLGRTGQCRLVVLQPSSPALMETSVWPLCTG